MQKNIVGIDISDHSLEAVVLSKNKRGYFVSQYSRFRLSPDIVSDGKVIDPAKLQEAIAKLLLNAKPKPISIKKVYLSVPESRSYTRVFLAPRKLKSKDLSAFIKAKAQESIPDDVDALQAVVKPLAIKGDWQEILYMAVKKETILSLQKVFQALNIELAGVCTEACSSFAGLVAEQKQKNTLLLDFGYRTSIASVFDKFGIRDSININLAGQSITEVISHSLGFTIEAAEEAKKNLAANPDPRVLALVSTQLDLIVDELIKFIAYYQQKYNSIIEQVVLIGGSAQLAGATQYISQKLSLPVVVGKTFLADDTIFEPMTVTKFINAVGLASFAYQENALNFLASHNKGDFKIKKKFRFRDYLVALIISLIIFLTLVAAVLYFKKPIKSYLGLNQISLEQNLGLGIPGIYVLESDYSAKLYTVEKTVTGKTPNLPYRDALEFIKNNQAGQLVETLNNKESNTHTFPQLINAEIIEFSPSEENYKPDIDYQAKINFSFAQVNNQEVWQYLKNKLNSEQKNKYSDWQLGDLKYQVLQYDPTNKHFSLKALFTLVSP